MFHPLHLLNLHQIGVLRVTFCQRRSSMGRQRVDAGAVVDTIATHIGIVPGPLAHGAHAGHDARRDLRFNSYLAAAIKDAHRIAVLDAAFFSIDRIISHTSWRQAAFSTSTLP